MKVTVIGSHLCPDTLYALCTLKAKNIDVDFQDLSANLGDLKAYLTLRDHCDLYANVKTAGGIGIPCFILEDGTKTLDLKDVLN